MAGRTTLADCFAAALAARVNGELLTGDPEIREVENAIKVSWLGKRGPGRRA